MPLPALFTKKFTKKHFIITFMLVLTITIAGIVYAFLLAEKQVTLLVDETRLSVLTNAKTVGDLVTEAGYYVRACDMLTPDANEKVVVGMTVCLQRAKPVFVQTEGEKKLVYTIAATVGELLADEQVQILADDRIVPEESQAITRGMFVQVIRITTGIIEEENRIPFATVTKRDSTLPTGRKTVAVDGEPGILLRTYRALYADGIEESRELLDEKQLKPPVNRVVMVGTKPVPLVMASRGGVSGTVYEGVASWVGSGFHGKRTAFGDIYDMNAMTCAFPDKALRGRTLRVTYLKTGRSVDVIVNDFGPHVGGRLIDLSAAAARAIGLYSAGIGTVRVEVIL